MLDKTFWLHQATGAERPNLYGMRNRIVSLLDEITRLLWRDVLVAMQDIVRIILLLESLEAIEGFRTERGAHTFNWLIGLHVVDVPATAERPRLGDCCGLASPIHLFRIEDWILPDGQCTNIERRVAKANRSTGYVSILRSTM